MIYKLEAYKIVEGSEVYHVLLDNELEHGDIVIVDMNGTTVRAVAGPANFLCDGCPFATEDHTCTVRNDSTDKLICHRSDGTYAGFEPLDTILESL